MGDTVTVKDEIPKGKKNRETKRSGNFRAKKGEEFHSSRDIFIREQLFLGCSNATGALPSIGEVVAREAIPLPISTRGVGVGAVQLAKTASKLTPPVEVDVRALYRAGLGLVEAKLSRQQGLLTKTNPLSNYSKDSDVSNPLIQIVRHIPIVPEPFYRVVNCIGVLRYHNDTYLPVLPKEKVVRGRYAPSSTTMVLSNLRRSVEALADPHTPRVVRDDFYRNTPIPGAIWDGRRLTNPDDIIPADYDNAAFKRDLDHLNDLAIYLERNLPKMAGGPVDLMSSGNQAQLLSNEVEDLRVPDLRDGESLMQYVRRAEIEGNITAFWSQEEVEGPFRLLSALCLLGETPIYLADCFPLYLRRMDEANQFRYKLDTAGAAKCVYSIH